MSLITSSIKGTLDLLPKDSYKTQYIEAAMREIAENYGFYEMRTPVFEHTELFERGVGDTTDVVQKEMYTFSDKGGRSITLRPEGTAGAVRAFLENGLFNEPMPQKSTISSRAIATKTAGRQAPRIPPVRRGMLRRRRSLAGRGNYSTRKRGVQLPRRIKSFTRNKLHRLQKMPRGVSQGIEGIFCIPY